jgi:hypothetical protein
MIINKIKSRYTKSLTGVLAVVLLAGPMGCTDKFDELNTPTHLITESKIDANLLGQAFAQSQYFGLHANVFQVAQNLYGDIYSQYFSTTHANFNSDQFQETGSWTASNWSDFYSSPAVSLDLVLKSTDGVANAIAKVWKVEMYHRMTDYFGPIIYSQFGNKKTSTAYDSQEAVYKDFFKVLDEASAVLKANPGATAFAAHDQIYAGSADKWLKFANSLRLRLAIRIAYVEPALARAEAEKAVTAGVFTANSEGAFVISTSNSINLLSRITYISEFRMSATAASILNGFQDPRISEYYAPAAVGGGYKGFRNGLPASAKSALLNDQNSFVGTKWLSIGRSGTTTPNRVVTTAEVYFLRAEGALRGWNMGGTAQELYNTGIRTSLTERTTASSAAIEAYIVSTNKPVAIADAYNTPAESDIPVLYDAAGSFERKLEQIITQKWIAIYPDGWESWAERRRTGYPKGYPIINSLNPDVPVTGTMRRLMFTTTEYSTNATAVTAAVTLLGGPDKNTTKLWWDKKP